MRISPPTYPTGHDYNPVDISLTQHASTSHIKRTAHHESQGATARKDHQLIRTPNLSAPPHQMQPHTLLVHKDLPQFSLRWTCGGVAKQKYWAQTLRANRTQQH